MQSSSWAEPCPLAPYNVNDIDGDDELTWGGWESRKQGAARRASASLGTATPLPPPRFLVHERRRQPRGDREARVRSSLLMMGVMEERHVTLIQRGEL
jgi:hypothetical protein